MTIYFDGSGESNKWGGAYCYAYDMDNYAFRMFDIEGTFTNNEMEYLSFIQAANHAGYGDILIGDSKLVINQLNGSFQVKEPKLKILNILAKNLVNRKSLKLQWVGRENNIAGKVLEQKLKE
jgi:ribonuclease HI